MNNDATQPTVENTTARDYVRRFSEPTRSGNYDKDCALGRQLADELLTDIRAGGAPGYLFHVVRDIARHGQVGGVQIGFFHRIAERAALTV